MRCALVFCVLLGACAARGEAEDAGGAIGAMLDDWHDAAARADEARYFAHFTDDAVFLGTDATERWSTAAFREYAHPHFEKGRAWSFRAVRRDVVVDGPIGWFDEDLATKNLGPARGSGVVVRRGGRWRIAQYNLALTIPNERFDLVKEAAAAEFATVLPSDPLARYAWLAGAWVVHREDGVITEEVWLAPRGKTMIGVGRTLEGGRTTFFELLRIAVDDDGRVGYHAQPLGKPATRFGLTSDDAGVLVFENPSHDWPKRIEYKRAAAGLEVRVGAGEHVDAFTYRPMVLPRGE